MMVKSDLRLPESTHAWASSYAARQGLSLSAFVRTLVVREQRRVAPPAGTPTK